MPPEIKPLSAGLYMVATPIGTARDITLRALDILVSADVLAAEDTRTLRHLMDIHGIDVAGRPLISYHDHNGAAVRPRLLQMLHDGRSVAYAPEAGTPMVSDPGFQLARAALAEGLNVVAAPGPSAVLAALNVSGLPSDRFLFAGFLPPTQAARRAALTELAGVPATLIAFESPKRLNNLVTDMALVLGPEREAAVCRELTKRFEEVRRGTLAELSAHYAGHTPKGEVVVIVDRGHGGPGVDTMEDALREALRSMSVKDAAETVATALGLPRRQVYQAALALSRGD